MAELDFISKFSGEEIDNILDKSQELLNKGYTFSGVATPETDPGTPSLKVFYLTTTAGKYANFDNITVESGKLTVLLYNGSMWQNQVLDLPKEANVVQTVGNSTSDVMSQDAVTEELSKKASVESVTDGISAHNTSSTSHADIRKLLNTCVGLPAYDSSSYKITFTTLAGASVEIDLPIEQLALRYNAETESIEFDNADGTTTSIPVSAFVKEYVGSIGDRIQISIDENNVIHATVLKNSIDWDCLSVELQARINDHVTSVDFATKVVRTDIAQSLSLAAQNQALENIGADLMIIDLVNGKAVLTEEQEARLLSCKGVILRGTTSSLEVLSRIFHMDNSSDNIVAFYSFRNGSFYLTCQYTKSTRTFSVLGNSAIRDNSAVVFNRKQSLTTSQQNQALGNIGIDFVRIPYSLLGTKLSDEMFAVVDNARGIILVDTPSGHYNPTVFIKGNNGVTYCYFVSHNTGTAYCFILFNKSTKTLTRINSGLTYEGSVRYAEAQNLTDVQKQQARSNIGVQSADELLEDADFIAQLKTKLGIA